MGGISSILHEITGPLEKLMIKARKRCPAPRDTFHPKEWITMLLEYMTDMSFVLATLIGGIIALSYVYLRRRRVR
ncbi:EYxxD motif small membrane protein [Geobacillus sp. YF-1]|uniref:EYxxD motif small membrane protein n=1 Tax=Geobacillus sp. YF-1 TaxID=3457480 RepID=UPI004045D9B1